MRVRDKPLRRQTRAVQVAARKSRTGDVKLAHNTRRHRLKTGVQNIRPIIRKRSAKRKLRTSLIVRHHMGNRINGRLGRAVEIGNRQPLQCTRNLLRKLQGEGLSAKSEMVQRRVGRRLVNDGLKERRNATDECHLIVDDLAPESQWRFPSLVADHNGSATADDRQQRLLNRCVERSGNEKRRAEIFVDAELFAERQHLVRKACMLDHNGLRRAGRARGVDHVSRVARVEVDGRRGRGLPGNQRPVGVEPHHVAICRDQLGQVFDQPLPRSPAPARPRPTS